ncbi:MAG TPA: hypothetical protein VFX16_14615 [Pseudonocardiaceae bacterium]|nr:hypothetical protein [Pseudonocardiaceae bacterium]
MGTNEGVGVPGVGRDGTHAVEPTPGQPRHSLLATSAPAVPEPFVRAWQTAYTQYGQTRDVTARMPADDPAAAWHMATASRAVANAWREITTVARLPWWMLAAVEAAMEAFESQARYWEEKENTEGLDGDPS